MDNAEQVFRRGVLASAKHTHQALRRRTFSYACLTTLATTEGYSIVGRGPEPLFSELEAGELQIFNVRFGSFTGFDRQESANSGHPAKESLSESVSWLITSNDPF